MARTKSKNLPWPWRLRGLYIVLGISLLVNVFTISLITYINSRNADLALASYAESHICDRDYSWIMNMLSSSKQMATAPKSKVLFSEQYCGRDVNTGKYIAGSVTNGHYHQ